MNISHKRQDVAQASLLLLRQQTKEKISSSLDSRKLLLAETKIHRDWRGLAETANLDPSTIRSSKISCTQHCLHIWIQKGGLIQDLWKALECMDRYDIIEDTLQYIYDDYDYALSRDILRLKPIAAPPDEILPTISEFDINVLTTDDQRNLQDGGTLQFYDALVLFADEDIDFVDKMVQKLEGEYKLKLCLKDRDLVGGLSFESSAVIRLIEERCARVIVVLSPAFLKSNANKFLIQYAHAHSIDQRRRIVIPCMVKPCQKPSEILYCHSLDYFRTAGTHYWDYWKKLADSITYSNNGRIHTTATIREIPSRPSSPTRSALPWNSTQLSTISNANHQHHSSGALTRFLRKFDEHSDKGSNETLKIHGSEPVADIKNSSSTSRDKEEWIHTGVPQCSESSTGTALSTAPLLNSSYDKRMKNMLRKLLKLKKKNEKIRCLAP